MEKEQLHLICCRLEVLKRCLGDIDYGPYLKFIFEDAPALIEELEAANARIAELEAAPALIAALEQANARIAELEATVETLGRVGAMGAFQ